MRDSGLEGYRKGIQDWKDTGKEGFGTGGTVFRTGGIQERRYSGLERFRTRRIQKRRDSGMEVFKFGSAMALIKKDNNFILQI